MQPNCTMDPSLALACSVNEGKLRQVLSEMGPDVSMEYVVDLFYALLHSKKPNSVKLLMSHTALPECFRLELARLLFLENHTCDHIKREIVTDPHISNKVLPFFDSIDRRQIITNSHCPTVHTSIKAFAPYEDTEIETYVNDMTERMRNIQLETLRRRAELVDIKEKPRKTDLYTVKTALGIPAEHLSGDSIADDSEHSMLIHHFIPSTVRTNFVQPPNTDDTEDEFMDEIQKVLSEMGPAHEVKGDGEQGDDDFVDSIQELLSNFDSLDK